MRYGLSLLVCFVMCVYAQAQQCPNGKCPYQGYVVQSYVVQSYVSQNNVQQSESVEALGEVNKVRAARGLKPFIYDGNLTAGALNVAKFRAQRLTAGHTANDFSGLPVGITAKAAGCAAWPASMGWGAC